MLRFDEKLISRARTNQPEETQELDSLLSFDFEIENNIDSDISEEEGETDVDTASLEELPSTEMKKDWRRVHKQYLRSKQYIFVAATLPENGKKTAGGVLKKMFPGANWVSGSYLHRHNPRLKQRWLEVSIDNQVDALIDAVNQGGNLSLETSDAATGRTMVFANTVVAVESVAKILQAARIQCFCYHRNSSLEESTKNLADFRERERGGVLVCTDAAARGLDIPKISHVI